MTDLAAGISTALGIFRERAAHHADADPESFAGQYQLGLADAYGDAAGLLEQLTSTPPRAVCLACTARRSCAQCSPPCDCTHRPGWPPQAVGDPFDLPIPRRERTEPTEETA